MRKYLDPHTIAKMRSFELQVKTVVDGFLVGIHKSPYHGFSLDFVEHRQFLPGDDPHYIDWKVYGKTDRLYLKRFEEDRNLRAYTMLDSSGSMDYRDRGSMSKWEYGSIIAASFSYLLSLKGDAVSLALFDRSIKDYLAPSTTKAGIKRITTALDRATPGGRTEMRKAVEDLSNKAKRRAFILVLSDLLDNEKDVTSSLINLSARGNELLVVQILDPSERDFPFRGSMRLYDMETKEEILIDASSLQNRYREKMNQFISKIKRELQKNNIDSITVDTNCPFEKVLYFIFRKG